MAGGIAASIAAKRIKIKEMTTVQGGTSYKKVHPKDCLLTTKDQKVRKEQSTTHTNDVSRTPHEKGF